MKRLIAALAIPFTFASFSQADAATCESLTSLTNATTTVTLAQTVAPGAFTQPPRPSTPARGGAAGAPNAAATPPPNPFAALPAFCRVAVTMKPTPQSDIKAEVWLPATGWNGKLQVVGNGAFAGSISYPAMGTALVAGYAAASTDTGHSGGAASAAVNKEVLTDFAHRAIHETAVAAKKVVDGFYGAAPKLSYFNGCSTGGRQALTEAQKYPDDFDGIIAGDAAAHGLDLAFGQLWFYQAMSKNPASLIPREKFAVMHTAVLQACDAGDGARDGVLENPLACRFDPQMLACKDGVDGPSCLTAPQVEAAQKIYGGARNTRTGAQVFPGLEVGSEANWSPAPVGYAVDLFKYIVFRNPNWDPNTLNFDGHYALTAESDFNLLDADNPDLTPFFKSGGKLLMYHGWSDPGIPARASVSYYENARAATGAAADESLRLFMVPGMGHCGGGQGVNTFNFVAALDQWVTNGRAPATIPASRVRDGKVERTRPLCAYPNVAIYKGRGNVDDAASFECRPPGR
jgi:feruloyl esterase